MAVTVKSPPKDLRTVECAGCGYILEYRPKDVIHVGRGYDDDFDRTDGDYILCPRPECRKRTKLRSSLDLDPSDYDL